MLESGSVRGSEATAKHRSHAPFARGHLEAALQYPALSATVEVAHTTSRFPWTTSSPGEARKARAVMSEEEHGNPKRPSSLAEIRQQSASRGASAQALDRQKVTPPLGATQSFNHRRAACSLSPVVASWQGSSRAHA